jgi:hypothetical protein
MPVDVIQLTTVLRRPDQSNETVEDEASVAVSTTSSPSSVNAESKFEIIFFSFDFL